MIEQRSWLTHSIGCWSWVWPIVIGGCTLDRPIKDILLNAGKWEVVEVRTDHDPTLTLPAFGAGWPSRVRSGRDA